jgi:hypothetical protein
MLHRLGESSRRVGSTRPQSSDTNDMGCFPSMLQHAVNVRHTATTTADVRLTCRPVSRGSLGMRVTLKRKRKRVFHTNATTTYNTILNAEISDDGLTCRLISQRKS